MGKLNDGEKIAIYSRKSKLTEKGESIENQVEMCKFLIKQKFENVDIDNDVVVYEDEGFSGGNINRPKFKELMNDARKKKFSTIVCYRLDRLSRNISDFSKLIDELSSLNIEFISVKEKFETDTPMGRAMMYIASIFSQLEREVIAERIRDNMMELAKTGRWLGGTTPTGYESKCIEKINVNGKNKKAFMLVQKPDEIRIIKIIFEKYVEFKSLTKLEAYLLKNGITTKNNKEYTRYTLKCILHNIVYVRNDISIYNYLVDNDIEIYSNIEEFDGKQGMMAYNKTMQRNTKTNRFNLMQDWVIAVGKHEGIISGETYIKAQQILNANKSMRYKKGNETQSLLSGILFCGECGSHMRPKTGRDNGEAGKRRFHYMCQLKDRSRKCRCQSQNVDGNLADKYVIEEIKKLTAPNSALCEELKKLVLSFDYTKTDAKEKNKLLNASYNKNQNEINSLIDKLKYIDNDLITDITEEIKNLKQKNMKIKEEMENNKLEYEETINGKDYASMMLDILNNYHNTFEDLDYKEQRELLKLVVSRVESRGKDIVIYFFNGKEEEKSSLKNDVLFPNGEYCK